MSVIADILEAQANVPKVFQAGYEEGAKSGAGAQYVNQYFSNALVGKGLGEAVRCEVSPIEHELDVNVEQENLVPYPYESNFDSLYGINYSYDGRTVTLNGYPDEGTDFVLGTVKLDAGSYTIGGFSLMGESQPASRYRLLIKKATNQETILEKGICNINDFATSFDIAEPMNVTIQVNLEGYFFADIETPFLCSGSMTPYLVRGELKEDMSGVKLLRYGKNIWEIYGFCASGPQTKDSIRRISNSYGTTISTIDPADSVTVTQTKYNGNDNEAYVYENGYFCIGLNQRIAKGTQVTVSFDVLITEKLGNPLKMIIMPNGIAATRFDTPDVGVKTRVVLTVSWATYEQRQYLEIRNAGCSGTFSNFQIELGGVATDYEPVNVTEHTPNEDGTVEGVMSVYPVTTLMTDTDGIIIDATYNKDANKVVASLEERIAALESAIVSQ